jgi:flagellar hook-associated protein 1
MGGTLNNILSTARLGMQASQTAISVASHNISNAQNESYSRQRADLVANFPFDTPFGSLGTGVLVKNIARVRDELLDPGFRNESSGLGYWQRKSDLLGEVEALNGDLTTGGGLQSSLDAFWNAWGDLSNDPSSHTARTVIRQAAANVITQFHDTSAGLDRFRQAATLRLTEDVQTVNQLGSTIAQLNDRIVASEAGGTTAGDLRDQRDAAIDQLSKLVGVQVIDHVNGSVGVHIAGINLVDANDAVFLSVDSSGGTFRLVNQQGGVVGQAGGAIGATIDFLNVDVPKARAEMDSLAQALVDSVNTVHETGVNPAGLTGLKFFEDFGNVSSVSASTIRLSPDIVDAQSIASGTGVIDPSTGNLVYASGRNDVAISLSAMRTAPSPILAGRSLSEGYSDMVGRIGSDLREAMDNSSIHSTLASQADLRRSSVSGVSIDEEMVSLIRFQNAYGAAARVISTVDEMMQTVLDMKR